MDDLLGAPVYFPLPDDARLPDDALAPWWTEPEKAPEPPAPPASRALPDPDDPAPAPSIDWAEVARYLTADALWRRVHPGQLTPAEQSIDWDELERELAGTYDDDEEEL